MSFVPVLAAQKFDDLKEDEVVIVLVVLAIALVIWILFFLTLHKALDRCSPRNRSMEPGYVWLNLIPCFNFIWMFITVNRLSESLKNEFYARRMYQGSDGGAGLGIACCILYLVYFAAAAGKMNPVLVLLSSLAWLVCWIIYWVKIAGFSGALARNGYFGDYGRRDRWDDDYDDSYDRPRGATTRGADDSDYEPRRGRADYNDYDDYDDRRRDDDDDRPRRRY